MNFEIIINKIAPAESNMINDVQLLASLADNPRCILHLYAWEGYCATYGYFIDPFAFFKKEAIGNKIQIARRPTGGGIIFHHCDFAFSVLIPAAHRRLTLNTLDNYALVNSAVIEAVKSFTGKNQEPGLLLKEANSEDQSTRHFCMAKPTKYDVMLNGLKVGGGAQRRTKHGLLHQGTIALGLPADDFLKSCLIEFEKASMAMHQNGFKLLGHSPSPTVIEEGRKELQFLLYKALQRQLIVG